MSRWASWIGCVGTVVAILMGFPAASWAAEEVTTRTVVSITAAVVSVPCGLILIAFIVRAYWRLAKDIPLSEREQRTLPKKMRWTWILTVAPLIALLSEPVKSCRSEALGLVFLLLIPTSLLGGVSHHLNRQLKARYVKDD